MASYFLSMLSGSTTPDASGNIWNEPADVSTTNQVWKHTVWRFKNAGSAKIVMHGVFRVPNNYVGTAVVTPIWSASVTTGNVVWGITYRVVGGDDTTSLDQTGSTESVSVTDAAPGAAWRRLTPSITPTAANLAAGSTVEYQFFRDKSSGSDTMASDAYLHGLQFQYADV